MRRATALGVAGVLALVVTGCGSSSSSGVSETAQLRASGVLITAPLVTASPTVFLMGQPTTETLPTGQSVTMTVTGPVLTNPVPGQKVQFADLLTETFTVTVTTTGQTPLTFVPDDFALLRADVADAILDGPEQVIVPAGGSHTWKVSLNQTPGQGYFIWRYHGVPVANWSYVAEND